MLRCCAEPCTDYYYYYHRYYLQVRRRVRAPLEGALRRRLAGGVPPRGCSGGARLRDCS